MRTRLRLAAFLSSVAASGPAAALGGTATDQAVSLVYGATHWSSAPAASLTGVDLLTGDQLVESGWWYRAEGDTHEFPLPAPDTETYAGGKITAIWNDLDGKGIHVQESTWVFDSERPAGGFVSYVTVANNNATAKQFVLFHYVDPDLAATSGGDSGALFASTPPFFSYIRLNEGLQGTAAAYRAVYATHFKVGTPFAIKTLLNDTSVTNLGDAGLPFGPGNVAAAYEFGPLTLAPGGSYAFAMVSLFVNPVSPHVKGDMYGVLDQPPLWVQAPDLSTRFFRWMRRTKQVDFDSSPTAPTATSTLAGVGDFDGAYRDSPVYRDTATGVTYILDTAVTGAPTLPLNWKLSATGDFSLDAKADILWRNTTSQKLVIWTMSGATKTGTIIPSPDQAVSANWEVAAAADFNGDFYRDLLWYNQTTGKIVIWYMNASVVRTAGTFTTPASVGNNNWRVVAVGDYGKGAGGSSQTNDIVWQNDNSLKVVVWHMDLAATRTSGEFTTPDTFGGWPVVGPR